MNKFKRIISVTIFSVLMIIAVFGFNTIASALSVNLDNYPGISIGTENTVTLTKEEYSYSFRFNVSETGLYTVSIPQMPYNTRVEIRDVVKGTVGTYNYLTYSQTNAAPQDCFEKATLYTGYDYLITIKHNYPRSLTDADSISLNIKVALLSKTFPNNANNAQIMTAGTTYESFIDTADINQKAWFKFTIAQNGAVTLSTSATNTRAYFVIYDSKMNEYACFVGGDYTIGLKSGTYYVCVDSISTTGGLIFSYTVKYSFTAKANYEVEVNNTDSTAQAISLNNKYSGDIGYKKSYNDYDKYDTYKFSTTAGKFYKITVDFSENIMSYLGGALSGKTIAFSQNLFTSDYEYSFRAKESQYTFSFVSLYTDGTRHSYTFRVEEYNPCAEGHTTDEPEITEPTCTKAGETKYLCTVCGALASSTPISAKGHTPDEGNQTTAPTCTTAGVITYYCIDCGEPVKTKSIKALGHIWNSGVITAQPTCNAKGITTYSCTRKGCTAKKTAVNIAVVKCNYKYNKRVAPTCTSKGYDLYLCTYCNAEKKQSYTTATGHSYDYNNAEITKEAKSCNTASSAANMAGVKLATCTKCGDKQQYKYCLKHTPVQVVTQAATCKEKGAAAWKCSKCKQTITEPDSRWGYNYGKQIGTVSISKTSHTYETKYTRYATMTKDGEKTQECIVCGYTKSKVAVSKVSTITLSASKFTFTGEIQKPNATVKTSDGKELNPRNYSITYSNKSSKACGKYTITLTFKYGYTGIKKVYSYTIIPKQVMHLTLESPKNKTINLSWQNDSGITGYQIYYSTKKDSGYKLLGTSKTNSFSYAKLSSGKTYYFKVRAYSKVSSGTFYGGYSATMYLEIK